MSTPSAPTTTSPMCPAGHGPLARRQGRTGPFWGCPQYPACRETAPVGLPGIACPQCGGPVVERIAKKSGKPFWPCGSRACDFVAWERPHLCAHGAACFGPERERLQPDAVPDPAIQPVEDEEVPF
jgi:ssDNA-binding Zn-finger/Zn-ribbon topoisomerase 1